MAAYTAFWTVLILWTLFSNEMSQTNASTLKLMGTPFQLNVRTKHMVKFHHAGRGEHPYSLSLQTTNANNTTSHICGATLILVQEVTLAITSASCLEDNNPSGNATFSLVAGVVESNRTEYQQRRTVCKVVAHEDFLNDTIYPVNPRPKDIALLFINMEKPFQIGYKLNVRHIGLPTSKDQRAEEPLIGIGWEMVASDSGYFISHVFETPTLTKKECLEEFQSQKNVECGPGLGDDQMCAANEEPFEGGSQSRGSPILPANKHFLAAIWTQSYSKDSSSCGSDPTPTLFTSIPYHNDWINKQVELHKKMYKQDRKNPQFHCN